MIPTTLVYECKIYVQDIEKNITLKEYIDIHYGPEIIEQDIKKKVLNFLKSHNIKFTNLNLNFGIKNKKTYLIINYQSDIPIKSEFDHKWFKFLGDYDEYIEYDKYSGDITIDMFLKYIKNKPLSLEIMNREDVWDNSAREIVNKLISIKN